MEKEKKIKEIMKKIEKVMHFKVDLEETLKLLNDECLDELMGFLEDLEEGERMMQEVKVYLNEMKKRLSKG